MATVSDYIANLIRVEGGYVNDPIDRGGATNYGVTQAVYDTWRKKRGLPTQDVRLCTVGEAGLLYTDQYWQAPGYDKVNAVDSSLAMKLLDLGVNLGVKTASGFVQRALNVLNQQGTVFPDLVQDGNFGPTSLHALQSFYSARGSDGRKVLLGMVASQASVRYIEIAEKNPSQEKFEYGWQLNRAIGSSQ